MDFKQGEVLLVDKPYGWTSFDVVNKLRFVLRRKYNQKKFKIGHAGTLDPLATGLLVLCTGKKTKEIESYLATSKTYTGSILLGASSPSYDLETKVSFEKIPEDIDFEKIREQFIGEIFQTPPIFSAKKVDGERAYKKARAGEAVEIKKQAVTIHQFELDSSRFPILDFKIECSKGTYIRSIAHDFGKACGTSGCLVSLRRIQSGDFKLENGMSVDEAVELIRGE